MPKNIRKTILIPEDSLVGEWAKNQRQFSPAVIRALEMVIKKYGTGDLIQSIIDGASLDNNDFVVSQKPSVQESKQEEVVKSNAADEKPAQKTKPKMKTRLGNNKKEDDDSQGGLRSKLNKKPNLNMLS